jgi:C-terminal processing protease CtpA/Prc
MSEKVIQDRQTDLGQYLKDLMSVSGTCDELRLFLGVFGHHKVEEYEDALKDPVVAMDPAKKPKKPERIKVRLDMGTSGLGARIMIEEGVPGLKIMDIKPGGVIDRAKKISVNDVIYEIIGTDVSGFSVQQLQYVLKTSGGTIDLVVEKAATRRH